MACIIKEESSSKCFGGRQKVFSHQSAELQCSMKFAVFEPPQLSKGAVAVLYYLSGRTSSEQNFITKAGGQRFAAKHGLLVVCPDTFPRGCSTEGKEDGWTIGAGASYYLNATQEKWKKHHRMFSYVTEELPKVIAANYNVLPRQNSIMGHSMGGHGAIICALKNPGQYKSVSAFAPVCHPCASHKATLAFHLGSNTDDWQLYDSCSLVKSYAGPPLEILIDQGTVDEHYTKKKLLPEDLVSACQGNENVSVQLRMREQYDHSYYFITSFIEDHFEYHAKHLAGGGL